MKSYKKAIKEWLITICLCLFIAGLSIWVANSAFSDYPFFRAFLYVLAFLVNLSLVAHQLGKSTGVVLYKKIGAIFLIFFVFLEKQLN